MKTWIEISKNNLLHNFHAFERLVNPSKIIAVVKANAYGHGLEKIAQILSADAKFIQGSWLGVDSLEEALMIKKISGNKVPIIILGFTPQTNLEIVVKNNFRQVVYSAEQINKLQTITKKLGQTSLVHLKIETGTNRQGVGERELPEIIKAFKKSPQVKFEGAYSHFADIEDVNNESSGIKKANPFAARQLKRFKQIINTLRENGLDPAMHHMAASAASLLYPETHLDFIRLGISLYGLYSTPPKVGVGVKLLPVLSWKTVVAQIKTVKKGETVGYGRTWTAAKESKIAVLPIGYADGYSRRFGNTARVLINGQYAPIVGRICMNMCMAEVTNIKNIKVEDEVMLLGQQDNKNITVEELAALDGTINYEIMARLNPLIFKRIV